LSGLQKARRIPVPGQTIRMVFPVSAFNRKVLSLKPKRMKLVAPELTILSLMVLPELADEVLMVLEARKWEHIPLLVFWVDSWIFVRTPTVS
jgi:hypothetical protein